MEWSAQSGLSQFTSNSSGTRIYIRRDDPASLALIPQPADLAAATPAPNIQEENIEIVSAPMAGICYLKPENGSPSFVSIGDTVASEQTVCIVEAMKVMTSIVATVAGTIEAILVEDGTSVDAGTPLVKIRT